MGFKQIDENTVEDDEGNTYYSPQTNTDKPVPEAPGSGTGLVPLPEDKDALPTLDTLRDYKTLPSMAGSEATSVSSGSIPGPASKDFKVDISKFGKPTVTPQAARNAAMTNDVSSFSAAGGTAQTDEDMARMLGGHAEHEADTAKAKMAAATITAQGQIDKQKVMAGLIMDTAGQYDAHVAKIMDESRARWNDWKKRNDTAAAGLIDPRHAMTKMSTLSRAGWIISFLGAGMQGGAQVQGVQGALNKLVEEDMAAQKFNVENKRQGLESEKTMLVEQDKLGKDEVADWYAAKNLRLTAIGKQLDAKIAEMGLPAAQAAGLLGARDAIEKEVLKGQQHVADHYNEKANKKIQYAHEAYMERLKSNLRMTEDAFKEKLKQDDKGDTLPTSTQLGLQMVDRKTGQALAGGKIRLKVKGEKAVEAGNILANANEMASGLNNATRLIKEMSPLDLVRGGTPELASTLKELILNRAKLYNGSRLSDKDVEVAAQSLFGINMEGGVISNSASAIKAVGPYKEGVLKAIERESRDLATKAGNKLQPYIDSDTAEKYDITYNPQGVDVPPISDKPDDLNTAIVKAAGGANTNDLVVPGARPPVTKDTGKLTETSEPELAEFESEKTKPRGAQGGLPRLQTPDEESVVEKATEAFSKAPADDVLRLAQGYLRNKSLSEEAKHEIRLEAQEAIKEANKIEAAVREEAMQKFTNNVEAGEGGQYVNAKDIVTNEKGEYTEAFKKYLESDLVNEMRRRAGLEARPR